jgi:hypothetical protein
MSYNAKNYTEQGGEKTVIGGEIVINGKITVSDGAQVEGITEVTGAATESTLGGIKAAATGEGDTVEVKIDTSTSKLYVPTYPVVPEEATTETAGTVKQAANVALATGDAPTKTEFNALINALIEAGLMAPGAAE